MVVNVDGDNILYHYLQKYLFSDDTPQNRIQISKIIRDLAIWLPVNLYCSMPVLLPYVVRDSTCRKSTNKKIEEWGSCDAFGYFRDDNTLIKAIPRKFWIDSNLKIYNKAKMGNGFVACHIWRQLHNRSDLASKNPLTNSFVPNLVWLPRQISKLTDREGTYPQHYLQALSKSIYHYAPVPTARQNFVNSVWSTLPIPEQIPILPEDTSNLNFFHISDMAVLKMKDSLKKRIKRIELEDTSQKLHCSRYLPSYEKLPAKIKADMTANLENYLKILD